MMSFWYQNYVLSVLSLCLILISLFYLFTIKHLKTEVITDSLFFLKSLQTVCSSKIFFLKYFTAWDTISLYVWSE